MANYSPDTKGLTPWKKGQTGNPGGNPKLTRSQRQALKLRARKSLAAMQVVVSIMENEALEAKDRLKASSIILQPLESLTPHTDAAQRPQAAMTPEERAVWLRSLRSAIEQQTQ